MRMRQMLREDWAIGALVTALAGLAAWLWTALPARVPTHWNVYGQVDGWLPKATAVWGGLALVAAVWAGLLVTPALDPRRENYARFAETYRVIRTAIVAVLAGLHAAVLLAGAGLLRDPILFVRLGLPLLWIVIGNSLGRVRPNFFVGIRTPWTLADDGVWRRTHRVGARALVGAGVVGLFAAALPDLAGFVLFIAATLAAALVPAVYSYLDFRRTRPQPR